MVAYGMRGKAELVTQPGWSSASGRDGTR